MKVVVSGLTAAGKTTLCRRLSSAFALPFFSGSDVLRRFLGSSEKYWSPAVDRARDSLAFEKRVDEEMLDVLRSQEKGAFDAWGLPWFSKDSALRIWIESDYESRLRKCRVSYLERGESKTKSECERIMSSKDQKSREVFLANWGFDIFSDRVPFDIGIDCSRLIPAVSIEAARVGAQRTFLCVADLLSRRGLVTDEDLQRIFGGYMPRNIPDIVLWS